MATTELPLGSAERVEWMVRGRYGLMVHWIAPGSAPEHGERITDLDRAVGAFDRKRFLADFEATGADWLIFTIGQNTGYYASPNAALDRFVGKSGHCSRRDLVREIAEGVHALGKRFIAYLPSEVKAQSAEIHRAFAWNPADQGEFQKRYTAFVREYALRFGKNLDGWWFDGCYTWPDFHNSLYQWPLWCTAARAGNPDAALAFNDGSFCVGVTQPVTAYQDYLSGEVEYLEDSRIRLGGAASGAHHLPEGRFVTGTTCQWHALVPIDCGPGLHWGHDQAGPMGPPRFTDENLFGFVRRCRSVSGAVTLNVGIYQEGHLSPATIAQLKRLRTAL